LILKINYALNPTGNGMWRTCIPYTGLSNARPETLEIVKRLEREKAAMPKSVQKYMN